MSLHNQESPQRGLVALLVALLFVVSGCSAGYTSYAKPEGGITKPDGLRVALTAEPANLDFTTTAGAAIPQALMYNVYEGLVKIGQDGAIQPLLAESWQLSEDRKSYTFKLREGVSFSNGKSFDAETVKFSIERVKSPAWISGFKKKMEVVSAVTTLDALTVRVDLSRPSQQWLYDMGTLVGAMFHPDGVQNLAKQVVGTGPYQVTGFYRGSSIELAGRTDYWGGPQQTGPGSSKNSAKLKNISLRYFANDVSAANALASGDVDMIFSPQPDTLTGLKDKAEYQVLQGTSTGEVILSMNNQRAPFNDVRVRQAVTYAIDRQAVMDTAWGGYGTLIGAAVPPTDPYYEDLTGAYPYNPEKARQLLAEAGAENLEITFNVPSRDYAKLISELVVSQLAEVGIKARIESTEFPAVWLDKVFKSKDYQMSLIAHVESRDLLTLFNNPQYYLGYDNTKIKALVAQADAAEYDEYISTMKHVVRTITDDAAAVPLFLLPTLSIAQADLQGIPVNSTTEALDLTGVSWKTQGSAP